MSKKYLDLLAQKGVEITLAKYKEHQTSDGYYMYGELSFNGTPIYTCEDGGFGGGCEVRRVFDFSESKNAKIKNDKSETLRTELDKVLDEINEVLDKEKQEIVSTLRTPENAEWTEFEILYENHISSYDYEISIDKVFYELAEVTLYLKSMKRHLKSNYVFSFTTLEKAEEESFTVIKKTATVKQAYKLIFDLMEKNGNKTVLRFDEIRLKWVELTLENVKSIVNA